MIRGNLQRLLVVAFWTALLFALVMALLPKPPRVPGDPGDKVQHVIAFATLAALASAAYPRTRLAVIVLGLAAFGALIEFAQAIPALHRDSSVLDWVADCAAVAAVLIVRIAAARLVATFSR
ncbi:hypothetical protein E2493_14170 [Sphingomonas parva]|uniref:VanZ family protein n=1 Tax=Sphingomonas parva TaxID=2555898 RepID=A0A4Y8ZNX5_9SPHN|nr:hypothetical protein [Sphingomonas parva]TFI57664.1 hypothetical protein E2493_14170 [Sphingomonas parva]